MKLIIDIDEDIYKMVCITGTFGRFRYNTAKAIKAGIPLEEEFEKIYEEAGAVELTTPKISKGYECYGIKDKTAEEMRTEILDIIYEHIKENKQ